MVLNVFVSHSMAAQDEAFVSALVSWLKGKDVEPYLAERDPQPGRGLSEKILERIKQSDFLAVFWTRYGSESNWVNQELGAARSVGKPVVPIVERGVAVRGLLEGVERIEFDREKPELVLESLETFLRAKSEAKDAEEQRARDAEMWRNVALILGAVAFAVGIALVVYSATRK